KALALLDDRPLLQHVLDAVADAGLSDVVVVLGAAADQVEAAVGWRGERRVRNPDPGRGLASSLQTGLSALPPGARAAVVALGDAWRAGRGPIVMPAYAGSETLNPVLLDRVVWPAAMALHGDRGMGPLIHASPELVTRVPVEGDNPDIDTPADLDRLSAASS